MTGSKLREDRDALTDDDDTLKCLFVSVDSALRNKKELYIIIHQFEIEFQRLLYILRTWIAWVLTHRMN